MLVSVAWPPSRLDPTTGGAALQPPAVAGSGRDIGLEHDPEKACPRDGGDGHRFSEKIMLHQ
jgi:hypothetical protein